MHLLSRVVLDIVDCEEAPGVVLVLLSYKQGSLIRRHLHACNLFDVLRNHDEVHLAHIGLALAVIEFSDTNVLT